MELPLDAIKRPLLRTRQNDQEKVEYLMESIAEIGLLEPVNTFLQFQHFLQKYGLISFICCRLTFLKWMVFFMVQKFPYFELIVSFDFDLL